MTDTKLEGRSAQNKRALDVLVGLLGFIVGTIESQGRVISQRWHWLLAG